MIKSDKLINREFLDGIKKLAEEIMGESDFRSAFDLSNELNTSINAIKNYKRDYYDLYSEYEDIIVKLRWVGLNILTEDKVLEMFQYNFTKIFGISDFNIWQKLRTVLLSIILLEPRDKFKKQLIQALLDNKENITLRELTIDNQRKEPTTGNWLLDYTKVLGTREVDGLARADYLVNGKNIKNLNEEEKLRIKILFDLYEKLKLSSQTFAGFENDIPIDDIGKEGIIRNGIFEPLPIMDKRQQLAWDIAGEVIRARDKKDMDLLDLRKMLKDAPAGSIERKVIEEEIERQEGE